MKKVFVLGVQPDPEGPTFGRVMDPQDFQKSQDYAHAHVDQVVKNLLVAGAQSAQVAGFQATVAGGLNVSVATGAVVDAWGISYESPAAASVVAMAAAHQNLNRLDLIYASLEIDANANSEFRPYRQLRTQAELEAGLPSYLPTQFNQPTELHTRATIGVKTGVPSANPVAPAVGANEVALWQVQVAAGQAVLVANDLTSVRTLMKSLYQAITDIVVLQAQMAVLPETVQDIVGLFLGSPDGSLTVTYNDAGNVENISLAAAYKALLDGATSLNTPGTLVRRDAGGRFNAGVSKLNPEQLNPGIGTGNGRSGLTLEASTGAITALLELHPITTNGSIKFAVSEQVGQNTPLFFLYQSRGADDHVRYQISFLGNHTILGDVSITPGSPAGSSSGNLSVSGNLSKGSGTFEIDHPLDPENKNLLHGFVEGPRFDLLYRGSVALVAGEANVNIDTASGMTGGTFAALTQNPQVWLQNKTGWSKVRVKAATFVGGSFTIEAEDPTATDPVDWVVIAERDDAYINASAGTDANGRLIVEVLKPAGDPALLNPITRVQKDSVAMPDEVGQEIVWQLLGTTGYPRHMHLTGDPEDLPTRTVTIETHDMNDNPYSPGPP